MAQQPHILKWVQYASEVDDSIVQVCRSYGALTRIVFANRWSPNERKRSRPVSRIERPSHVNALRLQSAP